MRYIWTILALCIFAIAVYLTFNALEGSDSQQTKFTQIKAAKAFSVEPSFTSNHLKFLFNENVKRPAILHFWATWCAPCVNELPELIHILPTLEELGYQVITIAEDENWETVNQFFVKYPDLKVLQTKTNLILDPKRELANLYGTSQFPETYIIGKSFKIESLFIGYQKWEHPEMKAFLKKTQDIN